jgi:hypothetical protein
MRHLAPYLLGASVPSKSAVANPASDYGAEYGPLSPDQLADLNRALTPVEQQAVTDWQSKAADTQLVQERAKGGPQSATVEVTPKGAVVRALPMVERRVVTKASIPWWMIGLGALGAAAVGYGVYRIGSRGTGGKK